MRRAPGVLNLHRRRRTAFHGVGRWGSLRCVISRYVENALRGARYRMLEDGTFCATVPGLRGVIANARTLEACREQLAEVVEEWVLVRVARGLAVPAMGGEKVQVRKAS